MVTHEQEEDIKATVVKYAAQNKLLNVMKHIASQGYNIHIENDVALCYAVQNEDVDMIKFLLDNGADIHAHDDEILNYAHQHNPKIHDILLKHDK